MKGGLGGAVTAAAVLAVGLAAACGGADGSGGAASAGPAPDSFMVAFETSAGDFSVAFFREWSPAGVDRAYQLAMRDHYAGARLYRVNPRYAQFGFTGQPAVDSVWVDDTIADEPVRASNVRGTVSFARGGPGTRSVVLFINRGDNSNLDDLEWMGVLGFPPVGRVESGMETVDALYGGYGEEPLMWEDSIAAAGNGFLDRRYPELDSIISVRVVDDWP